VAPSCDLSILLRNYGTGEGVSIIQTPIHERVCSGSHRTQIYRSILAQKAMRATNPLMEGVDRGFEARCELSLELWFG
jgi:hypothetical protein